MDPPSTHEKITPTTLEDVLDGGPSFHCDLCDTEIVHKIAQALLPGLASACVDNTMDGLFRTPASVAVDIRREMVDYLFQRSENFVAESVVLEGGADPEAYDHPYDIISDFLDDFSSSKRNIFSRVSGWLLSDRREDRIDDFVQEMEINGFWLLGRREAVAQTLLKNVDFKNVYHCDKKFKSEEELAEHVQTCNFRIMECMNEGCNCRFSAAQQEYHDSVCPFKILPCEQHCSESIMRREMDRHCITVCPMKLVNCPFYPAGCISIIPQSSLEDHRSDNLQFHLVCVLKPLHRDAPVKSLEHRAKELEKLAPPGRLAAARDARSLTYAIKDLEIKLGPLEVVKNDDNGGEVHDQKQDKDKDGSLIRKESSKELPDRKEEQLNPLSNHIESTEPSSENENPPSSKSSSENEPISSSNQKENMKSGEEHLTFDKSLAIEDKVPESTMDKRMSELKLDESSVINDKEPVSTVEKEMLHEPASTEDSTEPRKKKEEPSASPKKGDETI